MHTKQQIIDAWDSGRYNKAFEGNPPIMSGEQFYSIIFGKDSNEVTCEPGCMDCHKPYSEFHLDMVLPHDQWAIINPEKSGLLCAQCIVNRCEKVKDVVRIDARMFYSEEYPQKENERDYNLEWYNENNKIVNAFEKGISVCKEAIDEDGNLDDELLEDLKSDYILDILSKPAATQPDVNEMESEVIERLRSELKEEKEQHQISMNAMTNAIDTNEELTEQIKLLKSQSAPVQEAVKVEDVKR